MIVHRLDRCLIQCAMPAFEGLFPSEHDQVIQTLLFRLAQWHALAKLWLHTDHSLWLLDEASRLLGDQLCNNQNFTCTAFKTGAHIGGCSTMARTGMQPSFNTTRIIQNQCHINCSTKDIQPSDIQTPCPRRLCSQHPSFWNNGLLYNSTGEQFPLEWTPRNWEPEWLTDSSY